MCLLVGVVVESLLLFVAVKAAGGGHGTYLPAILFFPYAMAIAVPVGSIAIPLVMLASVQFPAYGAVIGATWRSRKRSTVWLTVAVGHLAAAAIAGILAKTDGNFWR
ncbi:MAG: hypothetical protein ACRD1B_04880 [Thermoanaerobaculia bacterium]